ncbi:hypothetical protein L9F63_007776, partial [Diploptera punctata]
TTTHTFFMIPKITILTSDPTAFQNRFYTVWEEFGEQFLCLSGVTLHPLCCLAMRNITFINVVQILRTIQSVYLSFTFLESPKIDKSLLMALFIIFEIEIPSYGLRRLTVQISR